MLKYVLLGILAERPRHGYDLKAAVEAAFGGTWPLNIGQIYTTLARLDRDGLVECEVVEQEALPDRKVYRLTAVGRKELERWLDEPARLAPPLHDEVFAKVLVHDLVSSNAETRAATIAAARHDLLGAMRSLGARLDDEPPGSVTGLLLGAAINRLAATADWLDDAEHLGSD